MSRGAPPIPSPDERARSLEDTLARRIASLCSARDADGTPLYSDEHVETFFLYLRAQLGMTDPAEFEPRLYQRLLALAQPGAVPALPPLLLAGMVRILEELGAGLPAPGRAAQQFLGTAPGTHAPREQTAEQRRQSLSVLLRASRP